MKTEQMKFKVSPEEKQAYQAALQSSGKTMAEVCRAALDRLVKRMEREK